ncbi:unnamed protein product [Leptidea sinapis]|uniref:Uncharacterized protein n=1 Tax=Leptidea sinapis TaxID=189913 RepID=A0A5E4QCX6_9NEOP|nr:unnamed protein product [Leptidea sinapis]
MFGVQIKKGHFYSIDVPGLAEKRPSLIKGDRLLIYCKDNSFICDGTISEIQDSAIVIKDFCMRFTALYRPHFLYNVRFMPLRLPMERMHEAVDNVFANKQMCRVFPKPSIKQIPVKEITRFYNPLIKDNKEQKSAVEHIVSGKLMPPALANVSNGTSFDTFFSVSNGKASTYRVLVSTLLHAAKYCNFYNDKEIELVRKYVTALVKVHNVLQKDIGIIAPYIRQVYKIKGWLMSAKYDEIEVGTVESFQGKEKRVVIVSCVRANSHLLDYDFKYTLGFLVDDKRFTVAVTRAKAKLIIIGNPTCLIRDSKWREYMEFCFDNQCYFGQESQQMERNTALLTEIAKTRFERCRLADVLRQTSEVLQN